MRCGKIPANSSKEFYINCVHVCVSEPKHICVLAESILIFDSALRRFNTHISGKSKLKKKRDQNTKFNFTFHLNYTKWKMTPETHTHMCLQEHRHTQAHNMYAELCTFSGKVNECSTLLLSALERTYVI